MNPYQFSDLLIKQSDLSIYSLHYIRLILLLKGYDLKEVSRILVYDKASPVIEQQAILHPNVQYLCTSKQEEIEGHFDLIIINASLQKDYQGVICKHLKEKGLACIHYDAMPGSAPLSALKDLMLLQISPNAKGEARQRQILQALYFTENYSKTSAGIFKEIPKIKEVLDAIKKVPLASLDESYLNPNWRPRYFSEVAKELEPLNFISSLHLALDLDFCLPKDIAQMLKEEEDILLKETMRDFALNQLFRTDLFGRNIDQLDQKTQTRKLSQMLFCLTAPREMITAIQIPAPGGHIVFDEDVYLTVLDIFAENHYQPKSIQMLKAHPKLQGLDAELFLAILHLFIASGVLYPANLNRTPKIEEAIFKQNQKRCEEIVTQNVQPVLMSSVLGSGISLSRIGLLLVLSFMQGAKTKEELAKATRSLLKSHQEELISENGEVLTEEKALLFLSEKAKLYQETILPYLYAIKAISPL